MRFLPRFEFNPCVFCQGLFSDCTHFMSEVRGYLVYKTTHPAKSNRIQPLRFFALGTKLITKSLILSKPSGTKLEKH